MLDAAIQAIVYISRSHNIRPMCCMRVCVSALFNLFIHIFDHFDHYLSYKYQFHLVKTNV